MKKGDERMDDYQCHFHSSAASVLNLRQYLLDYYRIFGIRTVVFRHSTMYGGRQFATYDQGWIGWFCQQAVEIEKGILKDEIPIHEEIQNNPNKTDGGTAKHKLFYISKKKNGFIKYILEEWYIETLSGINDNVLYETANGKLKLSSFVIKLHAKLIMGWDEEVYIKRLDFERFAFSPGIYIKDF